MPRPREITRTWLLDQLRFYRRQLQLHRFYTLAAQAFEMTDYVLDHGQNWADCVPAVRLFVDQANRALQGDALLPYYPN
jgi:hypothetical protein